MRRHSAFCVSAFVVLAGACAATPGLAAAGRAPAARAMAVAGDLPDALRRDIADFQASCAGWKHGWAGEQRGRPAMTAGWLARADFNGDGVADFVVDARRWRCGVEAVGGAFGPALMLYTSVPGGGYRASLDVAQASRVRILPGARARLAVHVDATPPDETSDGAPGSDETLAMTDADRWTASPSGNATGDWRADLPARLPPQITALVRAWDGQCAATGRRLVGVEQAAMPQAEGRAPGRPLDLNGDGRPDHVLDTEALMCGPFGSNPQPRWASAPARGVLIAVLSRGDGSFATSPITGSASFQPSEDPARIVRFAGRDAICFTDYGGAAGSTPLVRIHWDGAVARRAVLAPGMGCDGRRLPG